MPKYEICNCPFYSSDNKLYLVGEVATIPEGQKPPKGAVLVQDLPGTVAAPTPAAEPAQSKGDKPRASDRSPV